MASIPIYSINSNFKSKIYGSGKWVDSVMIKALEEKLKEYLNVKYVILTNNGTSSLLAAYWVLKQKYSKLEVDPYTFPATYQPAHLLGYEVKYKKNILESDISIGRFSISTLVHLYGQPNQLVYKIDKNVLIEDACQAFGAEIQGTKVGTIGAIGCYSFYPTKSLHTCGHGGAVVTNNEELYKKLKVFIESGREAGKMTEHIALNLRMDEIKAEFLLNELSRYEEKIAIQRNISQNYLKVIPTMQPFLEEKQGDRHIYSVFNLLVENRDQFREFMSKKGVDTLVYYGDEVLPKKEKKHYVNWTSRIVCIPNRWNLTNKEIDRIKFALEEWFS